MHEQTHQKGFLHLKPLLLSHYLQPDVGHCVVQQIQDEVKEPILDEAGAELPHDTEAHISEGRTQ